MLILSLPFQTQMPALWKSVADSVAMRPKDNPPMRTHPSKAQACCPMITTASATTGHRLRRLRLPAPPPQLPGSSQVAHIAASMHTSRLNRQTAQQLMRTVRSRTQKWTLLSMALLIHSRMSINPVRLFSRKRNFWLTITNRPARRR